MVKLRYITRAEANAAYAELPKIYDDREGNGQVQDHPHFVQYVIEYLQEKYGDQADKFLHGGLNIYTTIDTPLQNEAEAVVEQNVNNNLTYYGAKNAAMVIMAPRSGQILAMVGSANFSDASIEGQVNITTSEQQPGSSIKPIVYAAAFEQGWNPGTVLLDAPFRIETPGAVDEFGQPSPYYEPQNYLRTFNGAVPIRIALSNSLNIPAVKAVQYIGGPQSVIDIARRMGIKHGLTQPAENYGLSIGLGSGELWPLELTNAYATFANNGRYVPANPILKITDSQGRVLYDLNREDVYDHAPQAISAAVAYQITSILTDSKSRQLIFLPGNLFETTQQKLGRPTAAKSGTTNDFKDIWTMGYTTDVTIGVWVGNTRNEPMAEIDGIQGAGPIWSQMMQEMHANPDFAKLLNGPDGQPLPTDFARPPDIYDGLVCAATGGRPTQNGGNRTEVLIQGGSPALRCDQLSAWQRGDLATVLQTIRERGGNFVPGAADSINRYAQTVHFNGGSGFNVAPPTLSDSG